MSTNKSIPRLRITWEQSCAELQAYFHKHGDCNVPSKYGRLGLWVSRQRNGGRPKLTPLQIESLNALNFDWETKSEKDEKMWNQLFGLLKKFIESNGHARVPWNYVSEGAQLGQWVTNQQQLHRISKIRDDRRRLLKSVGFLWVRDERMVWTNTNRPLVKSDDSWRKMYDALVAFKRENGHIMVSTSLFVPFDDETRNLGTWVIRQRKTHIAGTLKESRKQLLDDINFVWKIDYCDADGSVFGRKWEQMYEKLLAFKGKYGHCDVPAAYENDQPLAKWVRNHQRFERVGELDEVRFERLDVIGFVWEPVDSRWNEMYERLKAFVEKHGHCQISGDFEDPALGKWVKNQRTYRRSGKLKDNRFERLDALGFVWGTTQSRGTVMLDHSEDFTSVHGRVSVPHNGFTWDSQLEHGSECLQDSSNTYTRVNSHYCVPMNYPIGGETNGLKRNKQLARDAIAEFNKRQKLEY